MINTVEFKQFIIHRGKNYPVWSAGEGVKFESKQHSVIPENYKKSFVMWKIVIIRKRRDTIDIIHFNILNNLYFNYILINCIIFL